MATLATSVVTHTHKSSSYMIKLDDLTQRYWLFYPEDPGFDSPPGLEAVRYTFDSLEELHELVRVDPADPSTFQVRERHPNSWRYCLVTKGRVEVFDANIREWVCDSDVWVSIVKEPTDV